MSHLPIPPMDRLSQTEYVALDAVFPKELFYCIKPDKTVKGFELYLYG